MADANFIESCSACRFFLAPHGAIGVCRRYPTHQNRHGNDWCGEFEQKEEWPSSMELPVLNPIKRGRKPKVQA